MESKVVMWCVVALCFQLVAPHPYSVDLQRYSRFKNRPALETLPSNTPRPYQYANPQYEAGAYRTPTAQLQEQQLPKVNRENYFARNQQRYLPKSPPQQAEVTNERYYNNQNSDYYNRPNVEYANQQKVEYANRQNVEYVNSEAYERRPVEVVHNIEPLLQTHVQAENTEPIIPIIPAIPAVPPQFTQGNEFLRRAEEIKAELAHQVQEIELPVMQPPPPPRVENVPEPNTFDRLFARASNPVELTPEQRKPQKPSLDVYLSHPKIREVLATTKHQKRFLVIHPDGRVEHVDRLQSIAEKHPNYFLVNAGEIIPKINEAKPASQLSVTPAPVIPEPQRPVPVIQPNQEVLNSPSFQQAILNLVAAKTPAAPGFDSVTPANAFVNPELPVNAVVYPTTPANEANNPIIPDDAAVIPQTTENVAEVKPTESPAPVPLEPEKEPEPVPTEPKAAVQEPLAQEPNTLPFVTSSTTEAPVITTEASVTATEAVTPTNTPIQPSPIDINKEVLPPQNGDEVYAVPNHEPTESNSVPETPPQTIEVVTDAPTTETTTTAAPLESYTPEEANNEPAPEIVAESSPVNPNPTEGQQPDGQASENTHEDALPEEEDSKKYPTDDAVVDQAPKKSSRVENTAGPADDNKSVVPVENNDPVNKTNDQELPEDVKDFISQIDEYILEEAGKHIPPPEVIIPNYGVLDISNSPNEPALWFKTTEPKFWEKLAGTDKGVDVIYFFQIHNQPKIEKDVKTTIHSNGTVVEDTIETHWAFEGDDQPIVKKTTRVINPEDLS